MSTNDDNEYKVCARLDMREHTDIVKPLVQEMLAHCEKLSAEAFAANMHDTITDEEKLTIKNCLSWVTFCQMPVAFKLIEVSDSDFLLNFLRSFMHNLLCRVKESEVEHKLHIAKQIHTMVSHELFDDMSETDKETMIHATFAGLGECIENIKGLVDDSKPNKETKH